MINYDSILSAFDGKPTLLQWLKLIKKALDESVLKDITVSQDGANVVFTFNFEDGTSISTPAATLPKGDTGAKGDKGDTGVSVTSVDEVSNEVVGGQTLTTLRFNFSNGTNNEVVVHAENGKSGGGKLYMHKVAFNFDIGGSYNLYIDILTNTNDDITVDFLRNYIQGYCVVSYYGALGKGTVTVECRPNYVQINGAVVDSGAVNGVYSNYSNTNGLVIGSQTLIEL